MPRLRSVIVGLAVGSALASMSFATVGRHFAPAVPQASESSQYQPNSQDYLRVTDLSDGDQLQLEVAVRTLRSSKPGGPVVHLVGVVHIGDMQYYQNLQTFLDDQQLVLFEGVKPSSIDEALGADDGAKKKLTESRLRLLGAAVERFETQNDRAPASLKEVIESQQGTARRVLQAAAQDAWGNRILLVRTRAELLDEDKVIDSQSSFDLISRGSDGKKAGANAAADLYLSDQPPLTKSEKTGSGEGIQVKLAKALGLEFQLAAMDYTKPNWRNSDLSIDQVQDKFKAAGVEGSMLFSMLDGTSFASKILGMMLGFIERDKSMSLMVKVMMVETLANTEAMMERQPEAIAKMMKVIVIDRNEAVLQDVARILKDEPEQKSIALFYGAGHLPHLEERLVQDMGFVFDSTQWFTAIEMDLRTVKGGKAQAKQMRQMVRSMTAAPKKSEAPAKSPEAE